MLFIYTSIRPIRNINHLLNRRFFQKSKQLSMKCTIWHKREECFILMRFIEYWGNTWIKEWMNHMRSIAMNNILRLRFHSVTNVSSKIINITLFLIRSKKQRLQLKTALWKVQEACPPTTHKFNPHQIMFQLSLDLEHNHYHKIVNNNHWDLFRHLIVLRLDQDLCLQLWVSFAKESTSLIFIYMNELFTVKKKREMCLWHYAFSSNCMVRGIKVFPVFLTPLLRCLEDPLLPPYPFKVSERKIESGLIRCM